MASANVFNVVIDHVSERWWGNKTREFISNDAGNVHDVTSQWSLLYEPCVSHPVVTEPDTTTGSEFASVNQDWHHNLIINYDHRCPLTNIRSLRWVNNVCYNGIQNSDSFNFSSWGAIQADIIGSKFLDGPQSSQHVFNIVVQPDPTSANDPSDCVQNLGPPLQTTCDNGPAQNRWPGIYLLNNQGHAGTNTGGASIAATNVVNDAANVSMTAQVTAAEGAKNPTAMPSSCGTPTTQNCWFRTTPLPAQTYPIIADQVTNLDSVFTPTVGNSQRVDCNGNWVNNRNSQDARVVAQYLARGSGGTFNGNGYNGPSGSPAPLQGTVCAESQPDGIPDVWKTAHGLSTSAPINNQISPHTGLTMLETYDNGLQP